MEFASASPSARRFGRAGLAFVAVMCAALAACSTKKSAEDFIETPPEVLYNQGIAFLQQNDFGGAAAKFDQLDKEHP